MAREPGTSIIITDGYWMHIRHSRVSHRHYPEVRGEGRSLEDAAVHLIRQLATARDSVHGRKREAIDRAIADVRAFRKTTTPMDPSDLVTHRETLRPEDLSCNWNCAE